MKVKDLVELLKTAPQEMEVVMLTEMDVETCTFMEVGVMQEIDVQVGAEGQDGEEVRVVCLASKTKHL